jgi:hypothetical protein
LKIEAARIDSFILQNLCSCRKIDGEVTNIEPLNISTGQENILWCDGDPY